MSTDNLRIIGRTGVPLDSTSMSPTQPGLRSTETSWAMGPRPWTLGIDTTLARTKGNEDGVTVTQVQRDNHATAERRFTSRTPTLIGCRPQLLMQGRHMLSG